MSAEAQSALFISGVLAGGYAVASLFFLRFWRRTRDRLFAWFAASFALLLVQRIALAAAAAADVNTDWLYVVRLLAFVLIIVAIVDKNRTSGREG